MGIRQCKNTFNSIRSNLAPLEHNGFTTATPEHPKLQEAEESNFKNNFMMMIEIFKEKMKIFLKEIVVKTNKKIGINQ